MEAQAEHAEIKRFQKNYTGVTILGIILIVSTIQWLASYSGGFSLKTPRTEFNWHPVLMVIGMIFLYSQAILVYKVGRNIKKIKVKCIHAVLHIIIVILSSLALKAVFDSHNYASPPIPNLYSLHAFVGIWTFILFCIQLVVGFIVFLYPGASMSLRAKILPYHVIFGTAIFVMAVVSAVLGYAEKAMFTLGREYAKKTFAGTEINIIGFLTVIFGFHTLYILNNFHFKREEPMESGVSLQ